MIVDRLSRLGSGKVDLRYEARMTRRKQAVSFPRLDVRLSDVSVVDGGFDAPEMEAGALPGEGREGSVRGDRSVPVSPSLFLVPASGAHGIRESPIEVWPSRRMPRADAMVTTPGASAPVARDRSPLGRSLIASLICFRARRAGSK